MSTVNDRSALHPATDSQREHAKLAGIYRAQGLTPETAAQVARERVVPGGALAMVVAFGIGHLVGAVGI